MFDDINFDPIVLSESNQFIDCADSNWAQADLFWLAAINSSWLRSIQIAAKHTVSSYLVDEFWYVLTVIRTWARP